MSNIKIKNNNKYKMKLMIDFYNSGIHDKHYINIDFINYNDLYKKIFEIYNTYEVLYINYYKTKKRIIKKLYIGLLLSDNKIYNINQYNINIIKNNDEIIIEYFYE